MRKVWVIATLLLLTGCAGVERGCSAYWAENAGADWLVVQYNYNGEPIICWHLEDVAIANEPHSDGIYWKDKRTGHLIHLSGWYNRVQVVNGRFEEAAKLLRFDQRNCT